MTQWRFLALGAALSRFRFSIAGFFLVLTLVAFGLAATVSQSELAGSAAYTAFVLLVCLSVVGAVLRPLPPRAFWLGFALFGWTYWLVEFETEPPPPQQMMLTRIFNGSIANPSVSGPKLVTRHLLGAMVNNLTPSRAVGTKVIAQWRGGSYYSGTITEADGDQYLIVWDDGSAPQWTPTTQILPNSPSVLVAGHSLCGGLFGLLGAILTAVFFGGGLQSTPQSGRG
jgi:hypothetical protein